MMLIRSMSPEIIAVDEIGGPKDVEAISEAIRAGIRLIATIHGNSLEEIKSRNTMKQLFQDKVFKRYILMDRSKGVGTIKEIVDGHSLTTIYPERGISYVRN